MSVPAQRALKAEVVREQLSHLAHLDVAVEVEPVPGDVDGLGWRTRVTWAVAEDGSAGLRRHRSHEVVPVDSCRIAHPLVDEAGVTRRTWPGAGSVEVSASVATGDRLVLPDGRGDGVLTEVVGDRAFRVTGGGFWQVHPGAAATLLAAVMDGLQPRPGDTALDLYGGVGLFAAPAGRGRGSHRPGHPGRVGPGRRRRTPGTTWPSSRQVRVERGRVDHVLRRLRTGRADLVVLDPPRSGAGRAVVDLVARQVRPRRVAYVACDPAALARDLTWFAERGYRLTGLRAFDIFPMTHHVECVALLEPAAT